ncbi:MAG: C40 family peptidase [Eubacterium sp.]|nr:C40 family peptidase [Eubacterium sp.]
MSKTNTGLVSYVKAMVGHPYWYGCYGQTATKSLYNAKKKQYPKYYTWSCPSNQLGKKVFDCVGLIKGYLWSSSITATPKYNASQDVSANGMYEKCTKKGRLSTMPKLPGVLVFKSGHVGVYIGDGKVVEAKGHAYGVIESKLSAGGWVYWGYCPWITYSSADTAAPSAPASGNASKKYFKKYSGKSVSIVDALNAIGEKSSYDYRKKIAKANGLSDYKGTPAQNTKLLGLLKQGKLIKP